MGFTCNRCFNTTGGLILIIVFAFAVLVATIFVALYLLSEELDHGSGTKMKCFELLTRCIPVQSIKVVIVVWQIVTQVGTIEWNRIHYYIKLLKVQLVRAGTYYIDLPPERD